MRGSIRLADTVRAHPRSAAPRLSSRPVPAPKTASRGLRPLPHRRLSRWRVQATDASGKNRPGYDPVRRGAVLPQKERAKADPCTSVLYRAGNAFKYGGDGVTYSGLTIAALGAPAGAVGATPGLFIAEAGGAVGAVGQAMQDIAFARPGLETAARFAANLFGGRVFTAAVPSSLRSKFGDALAEEAGMNAMSLMPQLDPQRCPK